MASHTRLKSIRVLMTGAGAPGAPGIIASLRTVTERKITIIGVDKNPTAVGFSLVDNYYTVPAAEDPQFVSKLLRIAQKEKVDVIVPLVTRELEVLSLARGDFEKKGIRISISDHSALHVANNKYLLMQECLQVGVPTPQFIHVKTYSSFLCAVKELGYPQKTVCIKPPVSNGMRGFRILSEKISQLDIFLNEKPTNAVTDLSSLTAFLKKARPFPELLVMEYLPGDEYSVDVLVHNGRAEITVPRLRESTNGGISVRATTVHNKKIIEYSSRITEKLKLEGNIGLQFKNDRRGVPKIIECNPRVQGTIVLCTASGANLVYLAVKNALGEPYRKPKIHWGTQVQRYHQEMFYRPNKNPFQL